jgi:hypothetical protein
MGLGGQTPTLPLSYATSRAAFLFGADHPSMITPSLFQIGEGPLDRNPNPGAPYPSAGVLLSPVDERCQGRPVGPGSWGLGAGWSRDRGAASQPRLRAITLVFHFCDGELVLQFTSDGPDP